MGTESCGFFSGACRWGRSFTVLLEKGSWDFKFLVRTLVGEWWYTVGEQVGGLPGRVRKNIWK